MIHRTKLFITILSLVTLIAPGSAQRSAASNDLRGAIPSGEPQFGSREEEPSKKAEKQARKQAKKARKQAKKETPPESQSALADVPELSTGSHMPSLRFADA